MPDPRDDVTPSTCPGCGARLDAASGVGHDERPKPGDWSICFRCARPLVFIEGGALREATAAELAGVDAETADALREAQAAIRSYHLPGRGPISRNS